MTNTVSFNNFFFCNWVNKVCRPRTHQQLPQPRCHLRLFEKHLVPLVTTALTWVFPTQLEHYCFFMMHLARNLYPWLKLLEPPANGRQNSVKIALFSNNSVSRLFSVRHQMQVSSTNHFILIRMGKRRRKPYGSSYPRLPPSQHPCQWRILTPTHSFLKFTFASGRKRCIKRGIQDKHKTS